MLSFDWMAQTSVVGAERVMNKAQTKSIGVERTMGLVILNEMCSPNVEQVVQ